MRSSISKWVNQNRSSLTIWGAIFLLYAFFFAVGITCPIKYLTGVSCAGCGMTRAWVHALTLHFPEAFGYNPVFWIVPFLLFLLWLQKRKPVPARIGLGICLGIMLLAYCIRMTDPTDTVVVFAPKDGSIYRTIHGVVTQISTWLAL